MIASWKWKDYLALAKKLTEKSADPKEELSEAYARAAISRAYYAVYHEALALLKRWPKNKNPHEVKKLLRARENKLGIHWDLFIFLSENLFKRMTNYNYSQAYFNLLDLRKCADYELVLNEKRSPEMLAGLQVENAQRLFDFLQRQHKSTK